MLEFRGSGQVCSSTSRVLLQRNVASRVIARMKERLRNITIRDQCSEPFPGVDEATIGPIVSRAQYEKIWVIF